MSRAPSPLAADERMAIHTIGHSTRGIDELTALLAARGVEAVVDVRRFPASRRHPHFNREGLAASLAAAGIGYEWLPDLGGRRPARADSPHTGWKDAGFRGYADHMDSDEFQRGLAQLLALAGQRSTAIMCAEATPWRCHRQLIADALLARGVVVRHIIGPGPARPHRLTGFARIDGARVIYDGGQPGLLL